MMRAKEVSSLLYVSNLSGTFLSLISIFRIDKCFVIIYIR